MGADEIGGWRFRWRQMARAVANTVGGHAGTLLLVPLVALLVRGHWTFERVVPAGRVTVSRGGKVVPHAYRLWLFQDGTTWERGIMLPRDGRLDVQLEQSVRTFAITLQANLAETYRVQVSSDGQRFDTVWTPRPSGAEHVLGTALGPWISRTTPVRWVRVLPAQGSDRFAVSWVAVRRPPLVFHHLTLIPVLWGIWLLLQGAARGAVPIRSVRVAAWARSILERWAAWDTALAAALILAMAFELPGAAWAGLFLFLLLMGTVWAVKRNPLAGTLALSGILLVLGVLLPRALTQVVIAGIARFHELNVDHRMRPFVMDDINSDGIRFRGEAKDIDEDQFVVLFLGDSFTYGFHLDYDETYPIRCQERLVRQGCHTLIAVNMGWTSSSPLLSLRLLKEIGYKYKPDLVIYNLDMTDFSDDVRYQEALERGGDLEPDPWVVVHKLIAMYLPAVAANLGDLEDLGIRVRRRTTSQGRGTGRLTASFAGEKYFVTNHPLAQTVQDIERGVIKNLEALNRFCRDVLHVPMVLVIYPRAYQYSLEESPNNNERGLYEPLGPYVLEPFRYFEQKQAELPYPVISLLDDFRNAETSPLFFEDDPHWNAAGAELAAEAVSRRLMERGLVPCGPRKSARSGRLE